MFPLSLFLFLFLIRAMWYVPTWLHWLQTIRPKWLLLLLFNIFPHTHLSTFSLNLYHSFKAKFLSFFTSTFSSQLSLYPSTWNHCFLFVSLSRNIFQCSSKFSLHLGSLSAHLWPFSKYIPTYLHTYVPTYLPLVIFSIGTPFLTNAAILFFSRSR